MRHAWIALLFAACGGDSPPVGTGATTSMSVGTSGGMVALEGATITIPSGALTATQTITITSTTDAAPAGFTNLSPIYQFGPDGLTFAQPASISIAFTGADSASIIWSSSSGTDFASVGGTVANGRVTADVAHFSSGFAGSGGVDAGPSCAQGEMQCPDGCVDTTSNASDCGGCGMACALGQVCVNSACAVGGAR